MLLAITPLMLSIDSKASFGTVVSLSFIVVLTLLFYHLKELKNGKHIASSIIIVGILFWYLYPALVYSFFIDPEQYKYTLNKNFEPFHLNKSFFLIGIFISSFLFFSGFGRKYVFISENRIYERWRIIVRIALIASFIGILPILISGFSLEKIIEALTIGRRADKPWVHSDNIGNQTSGLLFLLTCCSWAGTMFLITYTMHSKDFLYKKIFAGIIAFSFFIFLSIDSGTRSLSMLALLPSISIFLVFKSMKVSNLKLVSSISIIAVLIFILLQLQLFIRTGVFNDTYEIEYAMANLLTLGGSIDYFIETIFSVLIVPNYHNYFYEFDLIYFTTFPIPRFIWPDKPVTEIVWFYTMERWGQDIFSGAGNIFPGLVGQYYMSFGYIGPFLIGAIFAFIGRIIDRRIYVAKLSKALFSLSVYLMYAVWLFVSFRYFSPGFLFPVLVAHLILVLSKRKLKIINYEVK